MEVELSCELPAVTPCISGKIFNASFFMIFVDSETIRDRFIIINQVDIY